MANTVAVAIGHHKTSTTEGSRLGTVAAEAQANTRKTFTTARVEADGSGYIRVERVIGSERVVLATVKFDGEDDRSTAVVTYLGARKGYTGQAIVENLWKTTALPTGAGERPCPCGRMTANDCAGECGVLDHGRSVTSDLAEDR